MKKRKIEKSCVAVLLGSDSDWEIMQPCVNRLGELGIGTDVRVLSAHRTPEQLREYVRHAPEMGVVVFICAAGMSAALAGAVAGQTHLPVIGVPVDSGSLGGLDALLSTVQMPPGVPVATVSIGRAGAHNAALLAARILSLQDESIARKLVRLGQEQAKIVLSKSERIRKKLQ